MMHKKYKVEIVVYSISSFFTVAGVALCLAGLFVPYWYEVEMKEGIVIQKKATLGLWRDRVCIGTKACDTYWISDDDYDRDPGFHMPHWKIIRGFETAATACAILALLALIPLWATKIMHSSTFFRKLSFILFYVPTMVAAFLAVVGCLIISSKKRDEDTVEFAPFLSGIGGAVLFLSGCMSCVVCRYDPSYGTLENPVSPTFVSA